MGLNKLASLEATLDETLPSDSLTGVECRLCRATSVAKNFFSYSVLKQGVMGKGGGG